jgi:hypothetical protein
MAAPENQFLISISNRESTAHAGQQIKTLLHITNRYIYANIGRVFGKRPPKPVVLAPPGGEVTTVAALLRAAFNAAVIIGQATP